MGPPAEDEGAFERWWSRTWSEREAALRSAFGDSAPAGWVHAFSWDDISECVPGGCAVTFAAPDGRVDAELTVTLGLSQPEGPDERPDAAEQSGYGWEFGLLTPPGSGWRFDLLRLLMTYVRRGDKRIQPGHRVPVVLGRGVIAGSDMWRVEIGQSPTSFPEDGCETRWLVFWPCLQRQSRLRTSTGSFGVLVGTLITMDELDLARQASSEHLLLARVRLGEGQVSRLDRLSLLDTHVGRSCWQSVAATPADDVRAALAALDVGGRA